jgi:hypothetical protein
VAIIEYLDETAGAGTSAQGPERPAACALAQIVACDG